MIRISRCGFDITKSVPDIQTHSIFFPCVRRSRGPMVPLRRGAKTRSGTGGPPPKNRNFPLLQKVCLAWDQKRRNLMAIWTPLTLSGRSGPGIRGRGSISPGEGDGAGSNSLPRTIRIAIWEIFSGSSRSGKFFHRFSLRVCAI